MRWLLEGKCLKVPNIAWYTYDDEWVTSLWCAERKPLEKPLEDIKLGINILK